MASTQGKTIPPFLIKLYEMTNEVHGQDECFKWSDDGLSFWVSNAEQFSRDVLPSYFKHNNYASFVRQLNLYGFRRSTEPKGKVTPGTYMVEVFRHPYFVRGRKDLLQHIHRKTAIPTTTMRRIKAESDEFDDAASYGSPSHALSHSASANSLVAGEASSPAQPQVMDEVTMLRERTAQLEREVALLRAQNQYLAGQQQQQGVVVQSLVNLMSKMGISLPDASAPEPMVMIEPEYYQPAGLATSTSTITPIKMEPAPLPRADSFFRDERGAAAAYMRTDSINEALLTLDGDDTLVFDMDLSADVFGTVGPVSS